MRTRCSRMYVAATLLTTVIVAGAAIAQAIRERSWQPLWSVAWLPAVLVATVRPHHNTRECLRRFGRRPRS